MKHFSYAFILITALISAQLYAQPWNDINKKTSQLPGKDKETLNTLLQSATAVLQAKNEDAPEYKQNSTTFNKSLKELSDQVSRIVRPRGSLSGILSKLTWDERLSELKNALEYILSTINSTPAMRINKQNIINGLTELISEINLKSRS